MSQAQCLVPLFTNERLQLSWLQNSMQDPTVAPLVAELARLQQDLDKANASIDEKLDRLEDAGFGVVELTRQLEDARSELLALEDDNARMARREERCVRRLQRLRCTKCRTKVDTRGLTSTGDADERLVCIMVIFRTPLTMPFLLQLYS